MYHRKNDIATDKRIFILSHRTCTKGKWTAISSVFQVLVNAFFTDIIASCEQNISPDQ